MFQGNPFKNASRDPHTFENIPAVNIQRSAFNRSHSVKTAFDSGYLVPIFADEVIPGDTFNLKLSAVARLSTPIAPFMDNLRCDFFFFYVPYRLLWTNFVRMMGEQDDKDDSVSYTCPISTVNTGSGYAVGSLQDYLGLPTDIDDYSHNVFLTRAYNKIYQDHFKDENLQDAVVVDTGNGPDTTTNYVLLKRGKRFDYFTSCLPWPQKATAVTLPLGTTAPVYGNAITSGTNNKAVFQAWNSTDNATQYGGIFKTAGAATWTVGTGWTGAAAGDVIQGDIQLGTAAQYTAMGSNWSPPYADLSSATASTIAQFRQAFLLQALYERDARGGTRYTEIIKSHFGVISPDGRLQRSELLGLGSSHINLHAVPQTSPTSGSNAQGGLAAFGTLNSQGIGFNKSFTEHGCIIGIASVIAPDYIYQQGLHRMWSRSSKTDFFWPLLQGIGDQAVLNKEIYLQGAAGGTADDGVFGYQERYGEMKFNFNRVTGKLRSTASGTLDLWHLGQKFTALPTLGDTFIKESPPVSRVVAVNTEPQIIMDAYFDLTCVRPMATYSIPGLRGAL